MRLLAGKEVSGSNLGPEGPVSQRGDLLQSNSEYDESQDFDKRFLLPSFSQTNFSQVDRIGSKNKD